MTKTQRRAMFALRRAIEVGAPFTVASDKNFHPALVELLVDGFVGARRNGKRFYWFMTTQGEHYIFMRRANTSFNLNERV